jgi:uncharacterized membrane-anchored protein
MRFALGVAAATLLSIGAPRAWAAAGQDAASEQAAAEAQHKAQMAALQQEVHPRSGTIAIPEAKAHLNLGKNYYFLPAVVAKRVLTEAWGNPPDATDNVLGIVFPAGKSFMDATWGAVINYEDTGHIADKDAASENYESVLNDMKSAAEEENEDRKAAGYAGTRVVGWAQAPTYDSGRKTLIWARNIKFDDSSLNALNYDVRTLGRTGVLSLNMVDTMPNLDVVRTAATHLGSTVEFDQGARYADYNASTDKLADFGLAGLVAGGAGLAVAKKAGLLGLLALFLKKGVAIAIALFAAVAALVKRRLGRGNDEDSEEGGYTG